MEHPYLSAVIIAFNEERNIGRCLDSLSSIADEILVIDSGSTDKTQSICEEKGARVMDHPFEGHVEQKNWAWNQSKGSWILSLDADECLSDDLIRSLKTWKLDRTPEYAAYSFNRLTSYCGRWVHHSGWYPDRKLRLWKRGAAAWEGKNPHDRLELQQAGESGWLSGDLWHYSYHNQEDHYRQIAYFSDIASTAYSGGPWLSWPIIRFFKAAFQWVKTSLIKGGWRDGKTGWAIARMSALATLEKYRKVGHVLHSRRLLENAGKTVVKRVLIARTDAIGDFVLTTPLAGWLKQTAPDIEITFLVRRYVAPVAKCAAAIDRVLIWDDHQPPALTDFDAVILAYPDPDVSRCIYQSGIPIRIGTGRRMHTLPLLTHRVWESRKRSGRHETWHGLQLLHRLHLTPGWSKPGLQVPESSKEWATFCQWNIPNWEDVKGVNSMLSNALISQMRCVIIHPGSMGSAKNWPLSRYKEVAHFFLKEGCRVLLTGTEDEGKALHSIRAIQHPHFVDTIGQLNLEQFMALIQAAGGLLASSTGPLHLAASFGKPCVGLYGNTSPEWPERWHPVGENACWLVAEKELDSGELDISVSDVLDAFERLWRPRA